MSEYVSRGYINLHHKTHCIVILGNIRFFVKITKFVNIFFINGCISSMNSRANPACASHPSLSVKNARVMYIR